MSWMGSLGSKCLYFVDRQNWHDSEEQHQQGGIAATPANVIEIETHVNW